MAYMLMRVHAFICDLCGVDFEDLGYKREVWTRAAGDGWTRKNGKHYCPKCSEETNA